MFTHSDSYNVHAKIRYDITELMQQKFVAEFGAYLYSFYERRNHDPKKSCFVWFAEQGGYSKIVSGRDPINEMFTLLREAEQIFGSIDDFRLSLQIYLIGAYRDEAEVQWLHVNIMEWVDGKMTGLEELLTFELDPYEGYRD